MYAVGLLASHDVASLLSVKNPPYYENSSPSSISLQIVANQYQICKISSQIQSNIIPHPNFT